MYQQQSKVGRPTVSIQHKEKVTKEYQSKYYLTNTKNKRLLNKLATIYNKENSEAYKNGICNKFSEYDFNNFFTGTSDPHYLKRQTIELYNKNISKINKEYDIHLSYEKYKPISIKALIKRTETFINYLLKIKSIDRAIAFYEQNKAGEWHTHILFNVINENIIDVNNYIESKWLMGICLNVPIEQGTTYRILEYCTKQMNLTSNKKTDKEKILNWNIYGDYPLTAAKMKKEKSDKLTAYKIKNNLTVKVDKEHQQRLNDRFIRKSA